MKVSKYLDPDIIKDGTIEGDKKIKNYPPLEKGSGKGSVQQVGCNASGNYSFAEGSYTRADGPSSHAEGYETTAQGRYAHAEGSNTTASGDYSHAEGSRTTASINCSHAEGWHTTADGPSSHAEGHSTEAYGRSSHTEGSYTWAFNDEEHAEGNYNKSIKGKTVHTVGIGESLLKRKNAHEIHTDGKHYIFGIGGYDGKNSETEGIKTLQEVVNGKQDKLTAGAGISIDENNNISINFDPDIFKVVTELPDSPIEGDERKIHLVPTSDTEGANAYDEYVYVDGTWEKVGSFRPSIDLSDYAKTVDIPVEKGTGVNSVVQKGGGNIASGGGSVALGIGTTALGYASRTEGYGSKPLLSSFTVTGEANTTTYNTSTIHTLEVGCIVMYNGKYRKIKSVTSTKSFTVDSPLSSDDLNEVNIYLVRGVAYDDYAHAEGHDTVASAKSSHAEGQSTTASAAQAHAEGWGTKASGNFSHAEGVSTTASNMGSHAEGKYTIASGISSHAEGSSTKASNDYSHAEGNQTTASAQSSHAEGVSTTASGEYSHAEGSGTTASDWYSHAEGNYTTASGQASHAEGDHTTASDHSSHAEGNCTTAYGPSSHAEGNSTIASGEASHAEGSYNYDDSSFIHMTGVGTGDSNRLNALSITHSGKVYIKDVGGYAGQGPIGNDLRNHLDSTDLTDYEIDVIFGTDVNAELNINSIYIDNLDGEYPDYPDWYEKFGVNDKYEFVDTVIRDGEVSGPSKSFNINQSHRFMNTDHLTLTYEGVYYFIFKDINGDDIDDAGGVYRMLINPNVDTYAAVSAHQLYGSTTSDGKYKFTMLNPDIDELYEGAPNMWSRQYVYYVEKVSN